MSRRLRVVVFGATGNVGSSLVPLLEKHPEVAHVVGVARRRPALAPGETEFVSADIERANLDRIVRGADAVVQLAWRIQPSHDPNGLWRTNVLGSQRIFDACLRSGVPALVYASSVGVYSPGPKTAAVDEDWPRDGVPMSLYARHKAEVERRLDVAERNEPGIRVVRLRPALTFKRQASTGVRRLFIGPLFPGPLARRALVPLVPANHRLTFQAVHSDDVADAYRSAIVSDVRGAFNIAADPVLDPPYLAEMAGARCLPMSASVLRAAAALTWRLRLQPSPPGWIDLALGVPTMDCSRARDILDWHPARGADDALRELFTGLRRGTGAPTPPLDPQTSGPLRTRELSTGIGEREAP